MTMFFLLFILSLGIFFLTRNPILFPTVSILAVLFVPVGYISFLAGQDLDPPISNYSIGLGFLLGGIIGVLAAAFLHPLMIILIGSRSFLVGSLIEELAKLIALIVLFTNTSYAKKRQGILLGASVGMGFAILENLGYIFTTFLETFSFDAVLFTALIRGVLAPFGHGTWSAILGGSLFFDSSKKHWHISLQVVFTYLLVSVLHFLWNYISSYLVIRSSFILVVLAQIFLVILGLIILVFYWKNGFLKSKGKVKHTRFFIQR